MSSRPKQKRVLSLRDLIAGYNQLPVISIKNLEICSGDVVALVGESGAGKSTLFAAIGGAINPISGTLLIEDKVQSPEWRRLNISRTLQAFPLLHWLTVGENLTLAAKTKGVTLPAPSSILAHVRAEHLEGKYVNSLSGGERCRASIAQAIVANPVVLLLDEPFNGLDGRVKREVADSVFKFARRRESAVLFASHDIGDAMAYSNRVIVLKTGAPTTIGMEVASGEFGSLEKIYSFLEEDGDI